MREDAVTTAKIQKYLVRWAAWWSKAMNQKGIRQQLLEQWLSVALASAQDFLTLAIAWGILTRAKRGLRWCCR